MRRLFLIVVAAAVLVPTGQAAGPAFGVRAVGNWKLGYFVYDAKPGTTVVGKIAVSNNGNREGVVKLFATDATTGQTSGTVYQTSGEKPRDVGSWVVLPATTLRLGPNERRVVPFTVRVPVGAAAGQHVGGIVAETAQQSTGTHSKGKTNVQITVRNLAIVAVQVNVPGPKIAKLEIGPVSAGGRKGYQQLLVRIANDGNVMVKPRLALVVTNTEGNRVFDDHFLLDTVLPHTAIDYPVNVTKKALGAGSYRTQVELSYAPPGGGKTLFTVATPTLEVTPEQVAQVFTSAAAPTPPPVGPAAAAPAAKGSGGVSPVLIGLLVVGGLALLAGGWFAATARARRKPPA